MASKTFPTLVYWQHLPCFHTHHGPAGVVEHKLSFCRGTGEKKVGKLRMLRFFDIFCVACGEESLDDLLAPSTLDLPPGWEAR